MSSLTRALNELVSIVPKGRMQEQKAWEEYARAGLATFVTFLRLLSIPHDAGCKFIHKHAI